MEDENRTDKKSISPIQIRLIEFALLAVGVIILLSFLGASALLILEVFALAGILAVAAIVIIIAAGGMRLPFRRRP